MQVVDMHCDTVVSIMNKRNNGETIGLKENPLNIDLTKMKKGSFVCLPFTGYGWITTLKQALDNDPKLVKILYSVYKSIIY